MPELPEIEVTRRGIAPYLTGRRISGVTVREPRLRWRVNASARSLKGLSVRGVGRRGKYLLIDCGAGHLIVHLGMSGSLRVLPRGTPPGKHDHFDLEFGDKLLRLHDPRRFGAVLWHTGSVAQHRLLASLGIEPLSREFDARNLHALTRGSRVAIKQLLMDGKRIVGVGNIYASESLFQAGIHPRMRAQRLSLARCAQLVAEIKSTLRAAIRAGGSSLRDYSGATGELGCFQMHYFVYGRDGMKCLRCGTLIRRTVQGQRSTYFCPVCQR
ncbi:MAG: bifunctional DNA-formamidopyrimidine glycosylase/DNA-(apurinic or apyrimidinic site) lyase [Betaproteobacteria bacterium]|nr:bifunctional DNA-formamidopyrimidine glycosylase/DNA-(apurinic or apyrimidinic site) lyase [Betaproteobacteria bacterium]